MEQNVTTMNFQISKAYFKWDFKVGLKAVPKDQFSILEGKLEEFKPHIMKTKVSVSKIIKTAIY
jgi:hypothetical protein